MPIAITQMKGDIAMYLHKGENLYLTDDQQVVKADDPRAATLLIATGCTMPEDEARRYGLMKDPDQAKQSSGPHDNKSSKATKENK
jgi:hypothetical protein